MTEFLSLFRTRRDYCVALLELSREQQSLIDADDYTQLLLTLGSKQRILGRMEELSLQHPQLWQRWRGVRDQLSQSVRSDCEEVLAETQEILDQLCHLEQTSTEDLVRRRDQTRSELESLSHGARTQEAYHDHSLGTARRLDIDH